MTTPSRTMLDLAAVVSSDVLEDALDDALRKGMSSVSRMRWQLAQVSKNTTGIGALRALLDARRPTSPIPESVLETKVLRILRKAGLPNPVLQHEIRNGTRLIARVDFALPDVRLAIEADGYRWHSGRARWQQDRARRNALTSMGWRILHVTWEDLAERPDEVVHWLEQALPGRLFPT